ncbi:MAG: VRR-NUC domain-containing protein, partial [Lentisphaerae bacterium]|nr:VRR-NUC domain-containing protein [Lentisphaerota bacterium]
MNLLEREIVKQIICTLKAEGVGWCVKIHGGPYQASGIPDILAIAPATGRLIGIEVKLPGAGRLTELQAAQIRKINEAGGVAGVAHGPDDALRYLRLA